MSQTKIAVSQRDGMKTAKIMLAIRTGLWAAAMILFGRVCLPAATQDRPATDVQAKPEPINRMAADADPSYEVETVKLSNPDDRHSGFHQRGRRLFIENKTLRQVFIFAYGIHPKQVDGEPGWFASEHYDIDGVLDVEGQPSLKQMQRIVQKMLAERFALKFHRETRELPVYALAVTRDGIKFQKSKGDPNLLGDENDDSNGGQTHLTVTNMSMTDFTLILDFIADKPVVNETGLTGKWDFKLTWTNDDTRVPTDANAAPGLFTAIQEQMGLKLDAVKAPAEVMVIDHVERPSAN
jgi:uncharacterized protein (TIGR03435 family)